MYFMDLYDDGRKEREKVLEKRILENLEDKCYLFELFRKLEVYDTFYSQEEIISCLYRLVFNGRVVKDNARYIRRIIA